MMKKPFEAVSLFAAVAMLLPAMLLPAMSATAAEQFPDPDGRSADMSRPVQVYILLGQSNMLGFGKINPGDKDGSLTHAVKEKKLYPYLVDEEGNWTERKDVRERASDGKWSGRTETFQQRVDDDQGEIHRS